MDQGVDREALLGQGVDGANLPGGLNVVQGMPQVVVIVVLQVKSRAGRQGSDTLQAGQDQQQRLFDKLFALAISTRRAGVMSVCQMGFES